MEERLTSNQDVAGSRPARSVNFSFSFFKQPFTSFNDVILFSQVLYLFMPLFSFTFFFHFPHLFHLFFSLSLFSSFFSSGFFCCVCFLNKNACKVEEEAYASSEEEAPEDEEPLEVNLLGEQRLLLFNTG